MTASKQAPTEGLLADAAERAARFELITAALASAETPAAVADLIVSEGAAGLGTASGILCLVTDDGRGLDLAAAVRVPPEVFDSYRHLSLEAAQPVRASVVQAVRSHQPQWFASNDELRRAYPELAETRAAAHLEAAAAIPILLGERPLGAIVFGFQDAREFSEAERSFLLSLAQLSAQTLERIRLTRTERVLRQHERRARAEADASREQLAFLVEISSVLSALLDYEALLREIAKLLVPFLADYASVYTLEDDQAIRHVATAHVDPDKQTILAALHAQVRLRLDSPHSLIAQVMRTGQALLDPNFDWQKQYTNAPQADREYLAALRPSAHIIIPLVARGHALGVIVLAATEAGRGLSEVDLNLAEDVASRLALAADNARLLQQAQLLNLLLEQRVEERTAELLHSENRFHVLVDSVQDYAIFLLTPEGYVESWNTGAQRIKGYSAEDIIGQHFSVFYTPEDKLAGVPALALAQARDEGQFEAEGWRVRQDGTRFWANVVITPVRSATGDLTGFAKVTRNLTERKSFEDELRTSREKLRQEMSARRRVQQQLEQAREEERARIAREVHDELGGALTGLKMGLRRVRRLDELPDSAGEQLDDLAIEIDNTVQVVRRIAHELRPAVLDDFGLLAALEWQFSEFEKRSGLQVEWHSQVSELSLPNEAAIACFRIFQEALTNIGRHAQATRVDVTIRRDNGRLVLAIADNGVGMPPDGRVEAGHLGLIGMRERAAQLSGELQLSSVAGQGTTVTLTVPLKPPESAA